LKTKGTVEGRKRDETNREEYKKKKKSKSKYMKKEIMLNYTETERGINRIKEDTWNRTKRKKRKSILVYTEYASVLCRTEVRNRFAIERLLCRYVAFVP
jgi:hypothetical protein